LELAWPEAVEVAEVTVVLDDDVEEDLINLHHHRTPYDVLPTLLRDYELQATDAGGEWQTVATVTGNRRRRRTHRLEAPVVTSKLRLVAGATNGATRAHVVSLRVYTA
jgi:hypothetical protein